MSRLRKVFEPVTDTIKNTYEDSTKTMKFPSKENNKALENLNNKLLETTNDRGILANYLMSPLFKITNPDHTSHFKIVKDPSSNRVTDLLINKTIPIILYQNLLSFLDTDKKFDLQGDLLKMLTNKNYNVDLANIPDKKIMFDSAKQKCFLMKKF